MDEVKDPDQTNIEKEIMDVVREVAAMTFVVTVSRWAIQISNMRPTLAALSEFRPILEARLSKQEIENLGALCETIDAAVAKHNATEILRERQKELASDND